MQANPDTATDYYADARTSMPEHRQGGWQNTAQDQAAETKLQRLAFILKSFVLKQTIKAREE